MIDTEDILTRLNDVEGTSVDLDDDEGSSEEETHNDTEDEESPKTDNSDDESDESAMYLYTMFFPIVIDNHMHYEMMRRPIFHKSRTPDQTQQPTQQRTPRTPELTQHSTPEMSQHHTPDQTPQNTPQQTPDPDMSGESSTSIINGAWKVGTMHDDGRIRVEVIEGVLEPSNKCSTQITSIMHERLEPKGFAWKSVSKDTKKFYFEEFKKWFVWRQEDNLVYEAWQKSVAYRYKDLRSRAREKWEKKKQLDNRIGKDVWLSWIEEWKTPECQKKTEIKRDNRKGGVVRNDYPATHTAGSSSHRKTAARLDLFYAPSSSIIAHFSNSSHPNSQDYEKLQTELEVMKERMKEMDTMQQRMKDMENLLARMADNQMQ
ncbi:hypothetical protein POM88_028886 [Heracleum sosnowskyi]|uniref:Transposase n=1 Tax=Heracleum sosnowskyi TaxID=360622 RepID=A0AAD8MI02_9APIA|nr:hypothetical protein POM88_028886 [Heracleum sosnowskyi]